MIIFLSALISGFYLGLVALGDFYLGSMLSKPKIAMSLLFGLALVIILTLKTRLYTGDTMNHTVAYLENKEQSIKKIINDLNIVFIGNFVGVIIITLLYIYSNSATDEFNKFIFKITTTKINYDIQTLILKSILCNICVCGAIILYRRGTDNISKIFLAMSMIFLFVLMGFEHCVVNMVVFTYSAFYKPNLIPMMAYNMVFVTIGNIIGGMMTGYIDYKLGGSHEN